MSWEKRSCYTVTAYYTDDVVEETGTVSDERIFDNREDAESYMRECEESGDYEDVCMDEDEKEILLPDEEEFEL